MIKKSKRKTKTKAKDNESDGNPYKIKPYKFTTKKKKEFLRLIREEGMRRSAALAEIGIARQTLSAHLKDDPALADALDEAEMDQASRKNDIVEDALFDAAESGNVTAIQVYLYNRVPERWSDKRNVQMTGPYGGPIQSDIRYTGVSVEELDRRIQVQYSMLGYGAAETQKTSLDEARKALSLVTPETSLEQSEKPANSAPES